MWGLGLLFMWRGRSFRAGPERSSPTKALIRVHHKITADVFVPASKKLKEVEVDGSDDEVGPTHIEVTVEED